MAPGMLVMNGLYANPYGMQNYYNNPYFIQAYNSPNYNQMLQSQQQNYSQQPTNTTSQTVGQTGVQLPNGSNVIFQGAQSQITNGANEVKEEKKGGNGLAWLLGLTATAIGTAWWLASRGQARNATGLWNQIKLGAVSLFKDPTVLKGADILKHKDALGINEALKWTDDAAKITNYTLNLTDSGKTYKVLVQDGSLKSLMEVAQENGTNKFNNITQAFTNGSITESLKNLINTNIKAVADKNATNIAEGILTNIHYTSPVNNGIVTYLANAADSALNGVRHVKYYPA